jgi:xanthine dehydrogenase molybdopterin-binding subunit B
VSLNPALDIGQVEGCYIMAAVRETIALFWRAVLYSNDLHFAKTGSGQP